MTCPHVLGHNSYVFQDKFKKLVTKIKSFFRQIEWSFPHKDRSSRSKVIQLQRQKKKFETLKVGKNYDFRYIIINQLHFFSQFLELGQLYGKYGTQGSFTQMIRLEMPKNRSKSVKNGHLLHFQAFNHCLADVLWLT